MISLRSLQLRGTLASLGYTPFIPKADYSHGDIYYRKVSFQNKKTDPMVFVIPGVGYKLKVWKNNMHNVIKPFNPESDPDDKIRFNQNLFINDDGFLISADINNVAPLISYEDVNIFRRPVIHGVDDRYDLGDRLFIISKAGILYSIYEGPSHKTLNTEKNIINVFDHQLTPFVNIKYVIQETLIGTYGNPLNVNVAHVFPKRGFWSPSRYQY